MSTTKPLSLVLTAVLGTFAAVACGAAEDDGAEMAPANFDAQGASDETKSTHLWIVNRAVDILSKHTADVPSAANTLAWMQDPVCKKQWQNGLLEADFLAPFNGAATDLPVPDGTSHEDDLGPLQADFEVAASHATWMSHFYDPDTGKNYLGFAKSSEIPTDFGHPIYRLIKPVIEVNGPVPVEAKGSALYRAGRAVDLLSGKEVKADHAREPKDKRERGCYELGVSLHYVTDLASAMHSSNFAATDRPRLLHSHWEGWAQEIQDRFVKPDWTSGPPKGDLASVVQSIAVASKALWVKADKKPGPFQEAIMNAYREGTAFDAAGKRTRDDGCFAAAAELATLGFVSVDLPQCWKNNVEVVKQTANVLGEAQQQTARYLAALALPKH